LDRSGFEVLKIREHRSGYRFMLRQLRLGLLRRAMGGSGQAAGTKAVPSGAVMALSIAKTRTLMALDLPVQAFLTVIRAPAITLYGLARVPE
jgi:hypothetical protein